MNRIDRYIVGLFLTYFLGALLIFATMYVAFGAMRLLNDYDKLSLHTVVSYYLLLLPDILSKMTPVACLLATMLSLSIMNRAHELIALFASGFSLARIAAPIFIVVFLISVFSYFVGDRVLPILAKESNFIYYHDIVKNPSLYSTTKSDRIWYKSGGRIFNIKTLNPKENRAQGLTLYYLDDNWELVQMITAKVVDLKGEKWDLHDGSVTLFTKESSFPITSQFQDKSIVMGQDAKDLSTSARTADVLNQAELAEFIAKNKAAGLDTLSYEVSYHSKFGFAFAAFVMTLIAVPFSVKQERAGGAMVSIGLGLGLVLAYWIFYSTGLSLGNLGRLPPVLAAWLPNIITAGAAVYLLRRQYRPS